MLVHMLLQSQPQRNSSFPRRQLVVPMEEGGHFVGSAAQTGPQATVFINLVLGSSLWFCGIFLHCLPRTDPNKGQGP